MQWEIHMRVEEQIDGYIAGHAEPKRTELKELHKMVMVIKPSTRLWFFDGRNEEKRVVSNPSIGYGHRTITYADGTTKEFYQIGISANKSGISIYILGIPDKNYLVATYGRDIGKATVTGYCIRFKSLKDVKIDILRAAIRYGFEAQNDKISE